MVIYEPYYEFVDLSTYDIDEIDMSPHLPVYLKWKQTYHMDGMYGDDVVYDYNPLSKYYGLPDTYCVKKEIYGTNGHDYSEYYVTTTEEVILNKKYNDDVRYYSCDKTDNHIGRFGGRFLINYDMLEKLRMIKGIRITVVDGTIWNMHEGTMLVIPKEMNYIKSGLYKIKDGSVTFNGGPLYGMSDDELNVLKLLMSYDKLNETFQYASKLMPRIERVDVFISGPSTEDMDNAIQTMINL